MNEEGQGL